MKNYVEGELVEHGVILTNKITDQLKGLGFQMNGSKFHKYGQVEAIVNELVPYVEKEGINAFRSLYLEEYSSEGKLVGKYENGQVIRFET
ncbi:MAG: hypothetical protein VR72_01780 [Clostridiaceae bacterium BRH_c20a]|nr:MAG: hypothetical protein VR72_01780 [Clostridiaceae bacterium BRH_c20a]